MPTVKLYLLGGFQITRDDQPLTAFRSDRARALLAYLALESNRPLTRPHLAKLFWGQYELKVARANLRGTLSNLRQLLQPLDLIHATYHTVQFHVSHPEFWCDLLEWQRQLDTLLLSGRPLPDAQLRKLLQLEFLEGFERIDSPPFLAWLQQRRQHWRMLLNQLHSAQPRADEIVAGVPASTGSPDTGSPDTGLPSSLSGYHPEPQPAGGQEADAALTADRWSAGLAQGWQGLPQDSTLHGREAELAQLRQWLLQERGRLVAILGMGGEGKTALAAHFVHSLAPLGSVTADAARRADLTADLHHDTLGYVLWRSLLNAPPLSEVLQDWLQVLSQQQLSKLPSSLDQQLDLLLGYLQRHRCLLVLDNVESILRSGERAGYYRPGYEDYGQLLQRIAAYPHQSYLLLTSREQPHELDLLPVGNKSVHTLRLAGLTAEAGQAMLRAIGLSGSSEAMSEVVRRYSGNPLGLKLVAVTIQELFAGRIADFLAQETLAFDDIRDVLDQHFARLAELERDLMFWLAIEREALPVSALYDDLVQPPPRRVVLEAVRSLQRRSLLERVDERIYLQNVIIEYMTDRLVTAMSRELADDEMPRSQDFGALSLSKGAEVLPPNQLVTQTYLNRYALVKAQAKEYVRASQVRLLLQPVADFLGGRWSKAAVAMRLQQLLQRLRTEAPLAPGYTAANLLHLLLQLQMDVRGYDFSKLNVWQAYLQGVTLHGINFDQADLTRSVFTTPIGTISSLAFSPGGEWLAAVANGGETCLWRTADRQVWRVLRRANFSAALAFSPALTGGSPQGAQLLACSEPNGTVSLWSLSETSELTEPTYLLRTPGDKVDALAFSPQARAPYLLASASSDNTVQVWEITAEQTRAAEPRLSVQRDHTLPHAQRVIALAFSPDGRTLITGSVDEVVCLWDVGSQLGAGQLRHTWSGCSGALSVLAFSPNGQLVASASADDYTVRLRDVATGQVLHVLDQHRWLVGAIAFSPDSKRIATGSHDQMVRLWDTSTGQLLYTLVGHTYIVWGLAFSPAGQILASGSHDQTVRLWDVQSGHPLYVLSGYPRALRALAHDAHQILASVGHDQLVHLWRLGEAAPERIHQTLHGHRARLHAVAFSPDGHTLASAGADETVRLWDVGAPSGPGQWRATLRGHTDVIYTIAFGPDNHALASGGRDRTIRLWDLGVPSGPGQERATLHGHTSDINGVAIHPAGRLLASVSSDQTLRLWDLAQEGAPELTSERVTLPDYGNADGLAVAFSPDGALLACSSTHLILVWEMASGGKGPLRHMLKAHTDWVLTLAFSPDGRTLASAGADMTLCLWDVHSGQLRHKIQVTIGSPNAVVFSGDGTQLFGANYDGMITCWDVASGECLQTLRTEGPYAGMNITGVSGLTPVQKAALKTLGAVEAEASAPAGGVGGEA